MSAEITFPIAETFYSIQGEGVWTGTPMFFIRLAGCNVGRYVITSDYSASPFQILHPEHATCTSFSGETFICDTDYRVKERLTINQILDLIPPGVLHVSLTGGEPFIHKDLSVLVCAICGWGSRPTVHIETSGTVLIPRLSAAWLTCSPKFGYLSANDGLFDEFKFVVKDEASEQAVEAFLQVRAAYISQKIFIQPVDGTTDAAARDFAVECVKRHPNWKLSMQLHKYLGVR